MRCTRLFTSTLHYLVISVTVSVLAQPGHGPLVNQPTALTFAHFLPGSPVGTTAFKTAITRTMPEQGIILGFAPAVSYESGGREALSIAAADVNRDGKPDLIVANRYVDNSVNGGVGVLLGNGDGTFSIAALYNSGGQEAQDVAICDLNGDGNPDVVVANVDSTVGVLLGNGDGTFQNSVTYDTGGLYALSVAVADVDGNGTPDLIVANQYAEPNNLNGTVGVLLGNGDGKFQPAVTYYSGGQSTVSVAASDINGDGKPDLVTASLNGKVGVLIGNGNGTFQTAVAYGSGGYNSISVAVGDINGDSTPDLLLANECGNKSCTNGGIGVLLGNGDGTFQTAVSYSSGAWGARSVALGDVNGDTLPDLVVANEYLNDPNGNGEVSILLGNGNGTFQPAVVYGSGGYRSLSIAVSDLNADGRPDLLADNDCRIGNDCRKGAVGVLINTSTATTTTTLASSLNPSRYGQAITLTSTVTADGAGVPDGTVTFADGATQLGTATLLNGTASLITSTLIGGTRSLTASYSAEGWFAASTSPSLTQVVARASVKATIGSSTNPSHVNQMVTFSALVSGSPTTPTGAVTFKKGTAILATAPLVGGQATFTTAFTKAGSFSIVASYSGDQNYLPRNSKAVKQVVQKYSTSTSLNSTPNPSVHGEAVKFTATVASAGLMPTGKVKFMDGTVTLGTATLNGGVAMLSKSKLAVGTHLIKAFYLGDNGSDKSTSIVLDQVVN